MKNLIFAFATLMGSVSFCHTTFHASIGLASVSQSAKYHDVIPAFTLVLDGESKVSTNKGFIEVGLNSEINSEWSIDADLFYFGAPYSGIYSLQPSAVYKINDELSLSAGLNYSLEVVEYRASVSSSETKPGLGYQVGAQYRLSNSISAIYRFSETNTKNSYAIGSQTDESSVKSSIHAIGLQFNF